MPVFDHYAVTLILLDIITSTSILAQDEDSRSCPQQLNNQEFDAIFGERDNG